jgi:hypothetical protein
MQLILPKLYKCKVCILLKRKLSPTFWYFPKFAMIHATCEQDVASTNMGLIMKCTHDELGQPYGVILNNDQFLFAKLGYAQFFFCIFPLFICKR